MSILVSMSFEFVTGEIEGVPWDVTVKKCDATVDPIVQSKTSLLYLLLLVAFVSF